MNKSKNVFISHYHKDDEHVQRLKSRFLEKGYQLKNSSIDSTKHKPRNKKPSDAVVKRLLRLRINWAGAFICLIGDRTHTREWVDYEIKKAREKGKKIIGVYTHGAKGADLPDELNVNASLLFGWNSIGKIIDAIENNTPYDWENPDGTKRKSIYHVKTVSC
jgi:MTH538 TIR-like domain (DUF1863)